jgi:hypothetical protein
VVQEEDPIETGLKFVTFDLRLEVTERGRFEEPHFLAVLPV